MFRKVDELYHSNNIITFILYYQNSTPLIPKAATGHNPEPFTSAFNLNDVCPKVHSNVAYSYPYMALKLAAFHALPPIEMLVCVS
jgi:hypothetical protein